jgi:hypothetical protein
MNIPKVIYLTYKNQPPPRVFQRWRNLNPDYTIDFSLDNDCISFLRNNFDARIVDMFNSIPRGMHKADLWRLCKLYKNGGVYADIDLVPHVSINELIKDRHTFYSCLAADRRSIFQAFIITPPKNPLILSFIFSFIQNRPYNHTIGPTIDMYNCIKWHTGNVAAEIGYTIDTVKINVDIGNSDTNTKILNLYDFPTNYTFELVKHQFKDTFNFEIKDDKLHVTRLDLNTGWGHNHSVIIHVKSTQSIYLFKENTTGKSIANAYVSWNNRKILDCRDKGYYDANRKHTKWT